MGGSKGGGTPEIPKYLQEYQKENIARATDMADVGYQPWTGLDVAGINDFEKLGMQQQNAMSDAFGLGSVADPMAGMPEEVNIGGMRGFSSFPMFQQGVENNAAVNPQFDAGYKGQFGLDPDQPMYNSLPQQSAPPSAGGVNGPGPIGQGPAAPPMNFGGNIDTTMRDMMTGGGMMDQSGRPTNIDLSGFGSENDKEGGGFLSGIKSRFKDMSPEQKKALAMMLMGGGGLLGRM